MIRDYFRLAYQSAARRKMRSWLTMLGIFIGIAAVVSLISLSQGLRGAIADQFINLGSDKLIVQAEGGSFGPPGSGVPVHLTKDDKEVIEDVAGVDIAVGRLIRTVKLEFKDDVKFSFAVSVPDEKEELELVVEVNQYEIDEGRLLDDDDLFKVLVPSHINEDFFEKEVALRDKILIQDKEFEVVGFLKKSGNPQQDHAFVLPEKAMRQVLGIEEDFDILPLKVLPGEDVMQVEERVRSALRKHRGVDEGKEDFTIETPQDVVATLNTILLIVQGILVSIAAISLLVGGIGIMNTMYTSVLERTKEIGIMKAVGAENAKIMILFLIEAGFLGFFGGIIGVALGIGISKAIEMFAVQLYDTPLIQAKFSFLLILGSLFFSFMIGSISGAFPAWQAARLKPIDALRKK